MATDSASPARTNVGLPLVGPGPGTIGGAGIASITLDAQGRITGATTGSFSGGGYATFETNGTPVTARTIANFSTDFGVVDNGGATRTDVTLANAGLGAGSYGGAGIASVTLDAKGRVTGLGVATFLTSSGASPGTFNTITFNGNGLVTGGSNTAYLTSAFYQTVEEAGSALTQRTVLNFDGTVVAADDVANARTNVGLPNVGPGAGLQGGFGVSGFVLDAQGRWVIGQRADVHRSGPSVGRRSTTALASVTSTERSWRRMTAPTRGRTSGCSNARLPAARIPTPTSRSTPRGASPAPAAAAVERRSIKPSNRTAAPSPSAGR